jgi:predicted peptidase
MKLLLASTLLLLSATQAQPADTQKPQTFESEVKLKVKYSYLLSLPDGYETTADKTWPLIVFLHGKGERGSNLELLKKHGPPKLIAAGKDLGAIVASLQCPDTEVWSPHGVKAVTDHLASTLRVDKSRIYLTGLSMGGFGTLETATEYPDTYAAIAPICGGAGIRNILADRLKTTPVWIFHGDADPVVSPDYSKRFYDALIKAGAPAKLTMYPGVTHDSWTATYDNPEFWEWLMAQKKAMP